MNQNQKSKRRRKKSPKTHYFTNEVDQAIVVYNSSETSSSQRKHVYNEVIYPAFDKLSENLINTYKSPYINMEFDDLKHDLVAFLTEKLPNFSNTSGKAYSYYTVAGKNYLIARNNKDYKKRKKRTQVDLEEVDNDRDLMNEMYAEEYRDNLDLFMTQWIEDFDLHIEDFFSTEEDQSIADSVLEIFKTRKLIDNFNKKAIYILIRERTGLKTQRITAVINIMKADFQKKFKEYLN